MNSKAASHLAFGLATVPTLMVFTFVSSGQTEVRELKVRLVISFYNWLDWRNQTK